MSSFLFGKRFSQHSNLHNLLAMVYNFMSGLPKKKKVCHTYLHLPLYSTGRKRNVATYRSCHIYYRLKNNNFQFQFTMKEIYEANHGRWPVFMKRKKTRTFRPKTKLRNWQWCAGGRENKGTQNKNQAYFECRSQCSIT